MHRKNLSLILLIGIVVGVSFYLSSPQIKKQIQTKQLNILEPTNILENENVIEPTNILENVIEDEELALEDENVIENVLEDEELALEDENVIENVLEDEELALEDQPFVEEEPMYRSQEDIVQDILSRSTLLNPLMNSRMYRGGWSPQSSQYRPYSSRPENKVTTPIRATTIPGLGNIARRFLKQI
jgi:hypothetical protein